MKESSDRIKKIQKKVREISNYKDHVREIKKKFNLGMCDKSDRNFSCIFEYSKELMCADLDIFYQARKEKHFENIGKR